MTRPGAEEVESWRHPAISFLFLREEGGREMKKKRGLIRGQITSQHQVIDETSRFRAISYTVRRGSVRAALRRRAARQRVDKLTCHRDAAPPFASLVSEGVVVGPEPGLVELEAHEADRGEAEGEDHATCDRTTI